MLRDYVLDCCKWYLLRNHAELDMLAKPERDGLISTTLEHEISVPNPWIWRTFTVWISIETVMTGTNNKKTEMIYELWLLLESKSSKKSILLLEIWVVVSIIYMGWHVKTTEPTMCTEESQNKMTKRRYITQNQPNHMYGI